MTTLDEIEARFERADKAQDAYLEGRSIITAMVRSVACTGDVPKLVAALRAVEVVVDSHKLGNGHIARQVHAAIQQALDG